MLVWCLSRTVDKTMNTQLMKCYKRQVKGMQAAWNNSMSVFVRCAFMSLGEQSGPKTKRHILRRLHLNTTTVVVTVCSLPRDVTAWK
jgi:hypothetical protein